MQADEHISRFEKIHGATWFENGSTDQQSERSTCTDYQFNDFFYS